MNYEIKGNEVYYKLYNYNGYLTIVCLQWFDEFDYNEDAFYEEDGKVLVFETEKEAVNYLNENFERENIDPEYRRIRKIEKKSES